MATRIIGIAIVILITTVAVGAFMHISSGAKETTVEYTINITPMEEIDLFVYICGEEVYKDTKLQVNKSHTLTNKYQHISYAKGEQIIIEAIAKNKMGNELEKVTEWVHSHTSTALSVVLDFQMGATYLNYFISIQSEKIYNVIIEVDGSFTTHPTTYGGYAYTSLINYKMDAPSKNVVVTALVTDIDGKVIAGKSQIQKVNIGDIAFFMIDFGRLN